MRRVTFPSMAGTRRGRLPRTGTVTGARGRGLGLGLLGLAVLAAGEEGLSRSGVVSTEFFPPASTIIRRVVTLLLNQPFLHDVRVTIAAAALGLLIASALGIAAGVVLGLSRLAYTATRLLIDLVRPIPAVAFVPLLVLVVGIGIKTVVITVTVAATWPVLLNTVYGLHGVDGVAVQAARACGAGRFRRLGEVVLPSAAPAIAAGVRMALGIALVVAVATELIVGTPAGIGSYIMRASQGGDQTDYVYAAVCIAGLLGLLCNLCFVVIEHRLLPWAERSGR